MRIARILSLAAVMVLHTLSSCAWADDNSSSIGDVQLETSKDLVGRVAKEAIIAAAITIAIILPYIFDQFAMPNSIVRYNGRKTDVVGSAELPPPNRNGGVLAPPSLPVGINTNIFYPGYPIDGPREYHRHIKTQKQAARASKKSNRRSHDVEMDVEPLMDLGAKPFTHVLIGNELGLDAPHLDKAAPLVAYPTLIRNKHRRVQPLYASSVHCCFDGAMDAEMVPVATSGPLVEELRTEVAILPTANLAAIQQPYIPLTQTSVSATGPSPTTPRSIMLDEPILPSFEGGTREMTPKKKVVVKKKVIGKASNAQDPVEDRGIEQLDL